MLNGGARKHEHTKILYILCFGGNNSELMYCGHFPRLHNSKGAFDYIPQTPRDCAQADGLVGIRIYPTSGIWHPATVFPAAVQNTAQ